ncbi:D-alanyl-D-alanine carboxypeptidase/D-alanyl-D-alanine endopeptidase [Actinacidiphila rubida]|uniref:D-alanyl-D-alanine carboxypeptidase / D-alanyl-D-alanine-endopeptidase (Penicillin-binding protein 4) n=1 Tax=Actinacidiphila rubida TaxID=310780 RepID=A0A1H8DDE1_9ACTN|nr:D-alanyl-D-alanine carboxypeptidase/D-alanyl-D-alanine-endopeptidase [Actinacidiphila rubida]SEN05381.1 D-alanyl-D-alanine carboxypeptidase / D-alanyl-D-alanine-endopeptidase (penicillin-binding protein 4) [Actinacidiphila rubida]
MPLGRTWQIVAGSAAIGLAVAVGAVAAAGPWESGQRTAERDFAAARDRQLDAAARPVATRHPAPPPAAAPVLRAAGAAQPQAAGADGTLAGRLDAIMASPDLGPVRTGAVIDVTTGRLLYGHRATTASTPASLTKIATAVAALGTLGPAHRLSTTVVTTAPGTIVLVGGGDPTLELSGLADDTAAALKARGVASVRLAYDTSFFAGPALHPIGYNENLAPVTALMAREGRLDGSSAGPADRATDPAGAAAATFAQLLRSRGVAVKGLPAAGSGAGGTQLAVHRSVPLSDLVERMLTNSDNDIAEALARQVARATGRRADFAGGAAAIRGALARYGVPLGGAVFSDGSGLDHEDALSPVTLARLLALAGAPGHPELRPVLTGLPVAAFTGTLASRFHGSAGAGLIRAKTGTLTGTNTIAGTTVLPDGRVLAFSFMTQGAAAPLPAESTLDHLATTLT